MKVTDAYFESVVDLSSAKVKFKDAFAETVVDLKDEQKLTIKDIYIESVVEHSVGQSVS